MSRIERMAQVQGPLLWYVLSISLATLSSCAIPSAALAQHPTAGSEASTKREASTEREASADTVGQTLPAVKIDYGAKGFEFATTDENFLLQIESRLQFRYAFPGDENPVTFEAFQGSDRPVFKIN